jgi:hypothetical protein
MLAKMEGNRAELELFDMRNTACVGFSRNKKPLKGFS